MGVIAPPLGLRLRVRLFWGKVRRFYLGTFRPGAVRRSIARRRGECRRCGACCQLGLRCWLLNNHRPITECRCHTRRPRNCRVFPIDERDLRDRDLVAPDVPCGYFFVDESLPASERDPASAPDGPEAAEAPCHRVGAPS